jgi:MFS transporter, putative metabolite:H+ symporter
MAFTPEPGGWISGWTFLAVFRFLVGFGNAGLIAVDIPLVQEFVPTSKRGWVAGLTTRLLPAGNLLGALAGAYLSPVIGWRGLFLVGLLPTVLVLMIRYWVPESPRWLMGMGRRQEARKSLACGRFRSSRTRSSCRHPSRTANGPSGGNCSNIRGAWLPRV